MSASVSVVSSAVSGQTNRMAAPSEAKERAHGAAIGAHFRLLPINVASPPPLRLLPTARRRQRCGLQFYSTLGYSCQSRVVYPAVVSLPGDLVAIVANLKPALPSSKLRRNSAPCSFRS